jgi:glutamyl-tRNA synthetase
MTCRTRFAPSPTGYLHIGGARTALYCWLEARHRGGEFVLRIEDTDRERSTQGAIDAILEAMDWLGLGYDEGPIYQTQRVARYREVAEQLVADGKAYYAYETREELDAMREAAMATQEKPRYNGAAREQNLPYRDDPNRVIRFKNPLDGTVVFDDLIKGPIEIANSELDDMVIFRPDGFPTYNFAVVVDDWDMGITEVIRGDDHINNTPRQINLYLGIGAPVPKFGHMPMILDGDQEIFTRQELIDLFDVTNCNSKAARLDMAKLGWVNQHFLKTEAPSDIAPALVYQLQKLGLDLNAGPAAEDVVIALRERVQTLKEMAEKAVVWYQPLENYDEAAVAKHFKAGAELPLGKARELLAALPEWTAESVGVALHDAAAALEIGMGKVAQPLRVAITGTQVSPDISQTVYLAGRDEALKRIDVAITKVVPAA